jgi:hypothetical protein
MNRVLQTRTEKLRLSIKGRTCAFGPNSYLVKREEYCVKEDKSLWGKELKMVKIFLEFSDFVRGYLRVWPNSYLVAGRSYLVEEKFRRGFRR